jgi:enoyl-CoA hydratase/carnithine racemase
MVDPKSYTNIGVEVEGSVVSIEFQDPENYNPIGTGELLDLNRIFNEIKLDRDLDVVVITGQGKKSFSSGGDIREYAGPIEEHTPTEKDRGDLYYETWKLLYDLHTPVIAKINGYCVGGGLILASYCDLAISVPEAKFGVPTCNIGQIPDDGSTYRLIQLIGERKAKELVYTANLVDAAEAERLGFVNDVVEREELDDRVNELISQIQANGRKAVKNSKKALNFSADAPDLKTAREHEDEIWWEQFSTDERERLVDEFLEN